ncbi:DUF4954 family protein, partial [uncultured Porphyromonas sp.]|uniref:DUF4954 family protein n=1 Tax=uncultured Porphyromonas sp. TaxID=159274 RepID=UPI0034291949
MRKLTRPEVAVLEKNNCRSEQWDLITVSDTFNPESCRDVMHKGDNFSVLKLEEERQRL